MPPQPNMQQLLKQAQKMQQDMLAAQESLKDEVVDASAGGGMVTVQVGGDGVIRSITIDPEAVDPEDVELLQDTVLAAVNEGLRAAQELAGRDHRWPRRRPGPARVLIHVPPSSDLASSPCPASRRPFSG